MVAQQTFRYYIPLTVTTAVFDVLFAFVTGLSATQKYVPSLTFVTESTCKDPSVRIFTVLLVTIVL